MKSIGKTLLLLSLSLLLTACTTERVNYGGRLYVATVPQDAKAAVNQSRYLFWEASDNISILQGSANERYVFTGKTGDTSGSFVKADDQAGKIAGNVVYALYPYDPDAVLSPAGKIATTLPRSQTYREFSFDPASNLMVAQTSSEQDDHLNFSNACGFLRLRLYGTDRIRRITLKGAAGELVSGSVSIENGVAAVTEGHSTVELLCPEEGELLNPNPAAAKQFWFTLPVMSFTKGISIEVENIYGEKMTRATAKTIGIERGLVTAMAPFEVSLSSGTSFTSFGVEYAGRIYRAYRICEEFEPSISICVPADINRSALIAHFTENCKEVYVNGVPQQSGVTPNDFTHPLQYRLVSSTGEEKTYTVYLQQNARSFACWGDSYSELPFQEGSTTISNGWPHQLSLLLGDGFTVYKGGHSGDRSNEIPARQGGMTLYTRGDFTMPAKAGEKVYFHDDEETKYGIGIEDSDLTYGADKPFRPERWKANLVMVNNCHINGVECILDHTQALGTFVSRVTDGDSFFVPSGTPIETYGSRISQSVDVTIIYMGQNGGFDNDYDRLVRQHWAMINHTASKQYIVFAWHHKVIEGYLPLFNNAFGPGASAYTQTEDRRVHVLNMRKRVNERAVELLLKTGAYSSESEIPEKDWTAIEKGDWPKTFFKNDNDSHPGIYGARAMAIIVEDFLKEMGFLYGEEPEEINQQTPTVRNGGELDVSWE